MSDKLKIVFMGTPEFAVASLDILVKNKSNIAAVITVPDKPAGRGQQLHHSAVKKYAKEKGLPVLQPEKLKDEKFIAELKALHADLFIVVAFRMLPEVVWKMPSKGTFNLHGSLLPQYRGAAPINRAVMNGEKETGVTTFFLQQEIDTGKILFHERTAIGENENAGDVHDRLMEIGAGLVLKTVKAIEENSYTEIDQHTLYNSEEELKHAPKIFKEDCRVDWNKELKHIHDHIRGLSPYPSAFTELSDPQGKLHPLKIFRTEKEESAHAIEIGSIHTDSKTFLKVAVKGGFIQILELQLAGKKRMSIHEFLRGFPLGKDWKAL